MSLNHSGAIVEAKNVKVARVGFYMANDITNLLSTALVDSGSMDLSTNPQGILWKDPVVSGCMQIPYSMVGWTKVQRTDAFKTTVRGKYKLHFSATLILGTNSGESKVLVSLCKRQDGTAVCSAFSNIPIVEANTNTYSQIHMFRIVQLEPDVEYHIRISSGDSGDGSITADSCVLVEHFSA